ncbi:MAG: sugar ABC transporter ATP-binding protein [Acidimicrobiales bacterium]
MDRPGGAPAVEVRGVSKRFGATQALQEVDVVVQPGEIRALVGENGSGKSTLIKVLSGYHTPDAGAVWVAGTQLELPIKSKTVRQSHLAFVHQDLGLIPSLTALENFELGNLALDGSLYLNWRERRRRFEDRLQLYGLKVDPKVPVGNLSRTAQALLAIARAVEDLAIDPQAEDADDRHWRGLLVLDEPTVSLPSTGVQELFELMRTVARRGVGVLFVSHDLDEVVEIAGSLSVMRNGQVVADRPVRGIDRHEIARLMLGETLQIDEVEKPAPVPAADRPVVAVVDDLQGDALAHATFTVRSGEILGLTGLMGSGYEEVCSLLFGAERAVDGTVTMDGRALSARHLTPKQCIALGIGYVPEDRKRDAGIETLSIGENLSIPVISEHSKLGMLQRRALMRRAWALAEEYQVRPLNPRLAFNALSGGNQQKVILAKWMGLRPELLLLREPTQGVDIGARAEIFRLIRAERASSGMAVVVSSTDLEQLCDLCDRVLVFVRGRVAAELEGEAITKRALTIAMIGDGAQERVAAGSVVGREEGSGAA